MGVVVLVGVGLVVAFRVLFAVRNGNALGYADRMGVHGGYVRIDDDNSNEGACGCDLVRWYIGPANADPTTVFTGPGLSLTPAPITTGDPWQWLVGGDGYTPPTGHCGVSILRLLHTSTLYDYPDIWHLSPRQVNGWEQGELDIVEVSLLCDKDLDAS